ncbi:MAG: hypothetical protein ACYSUP_15170 [Planctomycetota bacterium]|jgi:hypothetical protein
MSTQAQNLSREMILSAYKAAISPGPPIPPESTVNWQLTTVNSLLSSTLVENPLQIRPFRAKQTTQIPFSQGLTPICPASHCQKQTQNKPKQTQSKPNFPKTQKTTQLYSTQRVTTMKPSSASSKTNPNEPNQTQFQKQETADAFADLRPEKKSWALHGAGRDIADWPTQN